MLEIIFWLSIGALIGWNLPQPQWAKLIQNKIKNHWEDYKYRD